MAFVQTGIALLGPHQPQQQQHHDANGHHPQRDTHRILAGRIGDAGISQVGAGEAKKNGRQGIKRHLEGPLGIRVAHAQHKQRDPDHEQEGPEDRRGEFNHGPKAVGLP